MPTRSRCLAAAIAAAVVCMSSRAAAAQDLINPDRPGIADGSKVIDPGQIQIEAGLQFERHGDVHLYFVPALARVGVTRIIEVRVEGNTVTHANGDTGFAPISLGAKFALVRSDNGPTVGLIGRGFPPSGTSEFKDKHFTSDVRLTADIPIGTKFSLNPNAGVARYEDSGQTYTAGVFAMTVNYQPSERLNPFIDVGYLSSTGRDTTAAVTIDAGLAWIVGNDVQFDLSVGQGVSGNAPRPFVAGGISIRFERHRTEGSSRPPLPPR